MTPVVTVSQKAERGRIRVPGQPRKKAVLELAGYNGSCLISQLCRRLILRWLWFLVAWAKSSQDPISTENAGVMAHACLPSYSERSINRKIVIQASPGKKQDIFSKLTKSKGLEFWLKQ
jgi:hypothetical protein